MPQLIITGDEQRAMIALERIRTKLADVEDKLRGAGQVGRQAGESVAASFGDKAAAGVERFVTRTAAAVVSLGTVKAMLSEIDRSAAEAAGRMREAAPNLAQLAMGGGPGGLRAKIAEARAVYNLGTTDSLGQAGQMVLAFDRAQIAPQDRKLLARMQGMVPDSGALAQTVRAYIEAGGGEGRTGGVREVLEKGRVAGQVSGQPITEVIGAARRVQMVGEQAGWSPDEMLSMVAVMARRTGSADEAAGQLERLAQGVSRQPQFRGLRPAEVIRRLRDSGATPEQMQRLFGGELGGRQAYKGFLNVSEQLDLLTETGGRIGGGPTGLEGDIAERERVSETGLPQQVRAAESKAENLQRLKAIRRNLTDQMRLAIREDMDKRGVNDLTAAANMMAFDASRRAFGDEFMLGTRGAAQYGLVRPEVADPIRRAARRLKAGLEPLEQRSPEVDSPAAGEGYTPEVDLGAVGAPSRAAVEMNKAARRMQQAAERLHGGPTLSPVGRDR